MDRNTIIGFVLILLLVVAYSIYNSSVVEEEQARERALRDSIALVEQARIDDSIRQQHRLDSIAALVGKAPEVVADSLKFQEKAEQYGAFATAIKGTEEEYILENEKIIVTLSSLGGKVKNVAVKGYETFHGENVELFQENQFGILLPIGNEVITTDSLYFTITDQGDNAITFRADAGEGRYIEQRYSLGSDSFFVNYSLTLQGIGDMINNRDESLVLDWRSQLKLQEREFDREREYTTIYYKIADDEVDYISEGKSVSDEPLEYPLKWVAFKQQFFNASLVAEDNFASAQVWTSVPEDNTYLKELQAKIMLPYSNGNASYDMRFYFGPNGFNHLKKYDLDMEDMVPMGGFGLRWINRTVILTVFNFFERFTSNYGLIIFLLAVFIKLLLTPLTWRSYISSAKMRVLKPELDELKEKYKDDAQKMQMEQMKLYRKTGVSMMGGCIPLLLQMPILLAMYSFFPASIHLRGAEFLWAQDLSTYDSIMDLPFSIPFYGDHVSLFTILMAITSVIYARMNSQMTPGAGAAASQMKMLQYVMPFFLIFIFNNFSAGLTYYYLLYNVLSFGQQFFFMRFFIDEDKIREKIEERKKKPVKMSKWQKRLEEMQKAQQQKLQQQKKNKKGKK